MRNIMILTILCCLFFLFSGCVGKGTKKEIRFSWPGGLEEEHFYKEVVREFESEYPEIRIKSVHITGLNFEQKMVVEIAGNAGSDVFWWPYDPLPTMAEKGAFLDLGPYIEREKFDLDSYFSRSLQCFRWKDKTYGLPGNWGVYLVIYNKDLFDKEGLPYPESDWTWEEFRDIAVQLTKDTNGDGKTDQFGFSLPGNLVHFFPFVLENGGKIMDKERARYLLDSPEALEAFNFWYELKTKYHVSPSEVEQEGGSIQFNTGHIGMILTSSAGIGALEKAGRTNHVRFGIQLPPVRRGKRYTRYFADGYVIWAKSKYPEEAWTFLKFVTGEKASMIRARMGLYTPAWKSAALSPVYLTNEYRKKFIEAECYGVPTPTFPRSAEGVPIFQRYDELIRIGKISVTEGIKNCVKEVNSVLSQN